MAFDTTDFMTYMAIIMDPTQLTGIYGTPTEDRPHARILTSMSRAIQIYSSVDSMIYTEKNRCGKNGVATDIEFFMRVVQYGVQFRVHFGVKFRVALGMDLLHLWGTPQTFGALKFKTCWNMEQVEATRVAPDGKLQGKTHISGGTP